MAEKCSCDANCGESRSHIKGSPGCIHHVKPPPEPKPIVELRVVNIFNDKTEITHHVLEYRRQGSEIWEEMPVIYRGAK